MRAISWIVVLLGSYNFLACRTADMESSIKGDGSSWVGVVAFNVLDLVPLSNSDTTLASYLVHATIPSGWEQNISPCPPPADARLITAETQNPEHPGGKLFTVIPQISHSIEPCDSAIMSFETKVELVVTFNP